MYLMFKHLSNLGAKLSVVQLLTQFGVCGRMGTLVCIFVLHDDVCTQILLLTSNTVSCSVFIINLQNQKLADEMFSDVVTNEHALQC